MPDRAERRRHRLNTNVDIERELGDTARMGMMPDDWQANPDAIVEALNDFATWYDGWLREKPRPASDLIMAAHNWHALCIQTIVTSLGVDGYPAQMIWETAAGTWARRVESETRKLHPAAP